MKSMAIVYTLALMLPNMVMAQTRVEIPPETRTVKLFNKATGEPVGTITINGRQSYLRDKDGVHLKTMVRNQDGTISSFDPNGKLIETVPNPAAKKK